MRKPIKTDRAPAAIGPYSQAMICNDMLYLSGQLPLDPATGSLVEGDIGEQTKQIMDNIKALCEEAGAGLDRLVKTTIFLKNMDNFQDVNKAYASFFESDPPARSAIGVAALPLGAEVEIEAIVSLAS